MSPISQYLKEACCNDPVQMTLMHDGSTVVGFYFGLLALLVVLGMTLDVEV